MLAVLMLNRLVDVGVRVVAMLAKCQDNFIRLSRTTNVLTLMGISRRSSMTFGALVLAIPHTKSPSFPSYTQYVDTTQVAETQNSTSLFA